MKTIYFITQNDYKFEKFINVVSKPNFNFIQLSKKTPEIQAETNAEVAEFSANWAANQFNKSVICEDVGLYIHAYNGFPGPYLSQVEKKLKTNGFLKLMEGIQDRLAHWEYAAAFCCPGKKAISFSTFHYGKISLEARGKSGWHADKVFIPKGKSKTIAQLLDMHEYERNKDHYEKLIHYLDKIIK